MEQSWVVICAFMLLLGHCGQPLPVPSKDDDEDFSYRSQSWLKMLGPMLEFAREASRKLGASQADRPGSEGSTRQPGNGAHCTGRYRGSGRVLLLGDRATTPESMEEESGPRREYDICEGEDADICTNDITGGAGSSGEDNKQLNEGNLADDADSKPRAVSEFQLRQRKGAEHVQLVPK